MTIADLLSGVAIILGLAWGLNPPKWAVPLLRVATLAFVVAGLLFLEDVTPVVR